MTRPTAFIYHEIYDGRGFSRVRDSWRRYSLARDFLVNLGFFSEALRLYRQEEASDDDLLTVHSPDYIEHVRRRDEAGTGFVDYGDTPAYNGIMRRARVAVGGSLLAARLVVDGEVEHAFNPGGGLHHARCDRAGGFCVFNDVAIAVRWLQRERGLRRIAIVDFDGHHGDGTQDIFYREPVLTISLHRYGGRFYPRTGRADEFGAGPGLGYNLNLPLPRGTGDEAYLYAVREAVLPRLYDYQPEVLLVQIGADGHHADPLVRMGLTVRTYASLGTLMHRAAHDLCAGRLILVSGGGYKPEAVARCWATFLAALVGPPTPSAAAIMGAWLEESPREHDPLALGAVEVLVDQLRAAGALHEPAFPLGG